MINREETAEVTAKRTDSDTANVIAFPPLILLCTLALAVGLEFVAPLGLLPPRFATAALVSGIAVGCAALAMSGSGVLAFRRAGTNIEPHKPALVLVETGPYRFTRNPMYLGLITVMLGASLAASLDWGLPLTVILWLVLHHGVVLREEAYLRRKFGAPYEAFLARTRRWL